MTGRPAETWRKFTFSTAPAWSYALLVLVCFGALGLILAAVIVYAVSERATGHLPLTRESSRKVGVSVWTPIGLIVASPVLWIVAFITSSPDNSLFPIFFLLGTIALILGLIGRLVITRLVGPRGNVRPAQPGFYDRLVELDNVHPAFVAAANAMYQGRVANALTSK
jgi:hypothetical protein